ncbi:MAG: class I SAM-dependent methyltransferase [Geminicoccaceae bacterium]
MKPIDRWIHAAGHSGRTAWYLAHALAAARLSSPVLENLPAGLPDRAAYLHDLRALLQRDAAQIAAGRYAMPEDLLARPRDALRRSTLFFADLGRINLRRMRNDGQEVYRSENEETERRRRPRYYLQNFHYQTDGWMSEGSAELYDFQVDVLFNGAADVMRRQALLPIGDFLRHRRQTDLRLLDIATGTGRFLRAIKQNFPRLPVTGLDLSAAYLAKSSEALAPWSWKAFVLANAEALPFDDDSQDIVTSVYLLHELPKTARQRVASEMARVLKPGGRLILIDSLQTGDHPPFDGLLELFPVLYHEPYYREYTQTDLVALYEDVGLSHMQTDRAFMSKMMVFGKTGRTAARAVR